jgi:hypothetical protein
MQKAGLYLQVGESQVIDLSVWRNVLMVKYPVWKSRAPIFGFFVSKLDKASLPIC